MKMFRNFLSDERLRGNDAQYTDTLEPGIPSSNQKSADRLHCQKLPQIFSVYFGKNHMHSLVHESLKLSCCSSKKLILLPRPCVLFSLVSRKILKRDG